MLLLLHAQCWQHNHARASSPAAADARAGSSTQPRDPGVAGAHGQTRPPQPQVRAWELETAAAAVGARRGAQLRAPRTRTGQLEPGRRECARGSSTQPPLPRARASELKPRRRRRARASSNLATAAAGARRRGTWLSLSIPHDSGVAARG
jgi:hypothetical protein